MNGVCGMNALNVGETAKVVRLMNNGSMRRRLQDIGLVEGTEIACVLKSPSGDPVAYQIRGAVIALRSEDSSKIVVCSQEQTCKR